METFTNWILASDLAAQQKLRRADRTASNYYGVRCELLPSAKALEFDMGDGIGALDERYVRDLIIDECTTGLGPRNESHEHRRLAVVAAPIVAKSAADAGVAVVVQRLRLHTERVAAAEESARARVHHVGGDGRDAERVFQVLVGVLEPLPIDVGAARFPRRQDTIEVRAKPDGIVDDRRASDGGPLHDDDRVVDRGLEAGFLVEPGHHVELVLRERRRVLPPPLLEHDHPEAAARATIGHDAAGSSRPYDDYIYLAHLACSSLIRSSLAREGAAAPCREK